MEGDGIEVAKLGGKELKQCEDDVSYLALDIGGNRLKIALLFV